MVFLFRRQHILCQSKLIFYRLIVSVYLRYMRHKTKRHGRRTSPRWHCLHRVQHPIEQSKHTKKQSIVVRGIVSRIHKVKENIASISPSICFSAFAVIDGPTVNGLLLIVEAFTVFFDHFFLIFFLQEETNYKCDNTDNSKDVIKVCPLLLWPLFNTFIFGGRWPLAHSCGYELVRKNKVWMYF
jgi:hypothetical protein